MHRIVSQWPCAPIGSDRSVTVRQRHGGKHAMGCERRCGGSYERYDVGDNAIKYRENCHDFKIKGCAIEAHYKSETFVLQKNILIIHQLFLNSIDQVYHSFIATHYCNSRYSIYPPTLFITQKGCLNRILKPSHKEFHFSKIVLLVLVSTLLQVDDLKIL